LNAPGKSYLLEEGSLFFLKKGAIRQGRFHDSDWVVIVFCVTDNYLRQMLKEFRTQARVLAASAGPAPEPVIAINANKITQGSFYSLLPYFTQQPHAPESLLEIKCRELIFSIFADPGNGGLLAYLNSFCDLTKPPLPEVMEANYTYKLSLEEFARISQRSLTAFKNEFTALFHTTPGKWLIRRRLEYGRNLLAGSRKNISEIVEECGFESPTHFSRAFKSAFGVQPLQYRRQAEPIGQPG
jgi:AraC-like DNA-binding protein